MHQKEIGFSEYNTTSGYQTQANTFEYNGGTQNIHGGWRGQKKSLRSSRNHSNVIMGDLPPRTHTEHKLGDGSSIPMGKRSYDILGFGSISTKRARTALRRRIRSTLVDSASGGVQVETKPGVSSRCTNPFGDKQNSVCIKLQTSKSLFINSTSDVRALLPTDYTGTLAIPEKVKSMQLGTTFEQRWQQDPRMPKEQALCDLILDLGANWELVSDAINNGVLEMDSVINMSWHSEDTLKVDALKSRFKKIIMLWKRQNDLKVQNNHLNEKGVLPVHSSHLLSISRVSSNGDPLTPLDHCESGTVGTDAISGGYQSCPTSDLGSSDIIMVPVHVTSACSMLQESSSGNSLPSSTFTASSRHSQNSNIQRQSNQLLSERQHVKQLSRVLAIGKNQQSGFSSGFSTSSMPLPVSDCDVETQPGEGGMSMVHESNRSTPLPMPRLQWRGTSSRVRRPSMHAGEASGQGGSSVRRREASHGVRISL